MLIGHYPSKSDLQHSIGQPLRYEETHVLVPEYMPFGTVVVCGQRSPDAEHPWVAEVTLIGGKIVAVE